MEWKTQDRLIGYEEAIAFMEQRADAIAQGCAGECIWLLEHPALYTAGTSAKTTDLLHAAFPTYHTGRGGQYTYHGPGQLIAYVMLNLKARYAPNVPDVRDFVRSLEQWIIDALTQCDIASERREGRVGIWVARNDGSGIDDKIAALGIRIRRGVSFHGIAINVSPNLGHYSGIIPCGISTHGITSAEQLGKNIGLNTVKDYVRLTCPF
jgi:lipoyl(octanoyl) transferase